MDDGDSSSDEQRQRDQAEGDFDIAGESSGQDDNDYDHPEGWDVVSFIKKLVDDVGYSSAIDFGCGEGRFCKSFDPGKYLGLDLDENNVSDARKKFPHYQFDHRFNVARRADIYFAYSAFMALKNSDLNKFLKKIRCNWLIIGEILGREWSRKASPTIHGRNLSDYVQMLRSHDLILHKHIKKPHKKYSTVKWYKGMNTNISFLMFRKCISNSYKRVNTHM